MPATPTTRKATKRAARKGAAPAPARAKIVRLVPRRLLERVVRAQGGKSKTGGGCIKCGSMFIAIEPAFIHCKYCGNMSRIRGASLLAQEEWEMR